MDQRQQLVARIFDTIFQFILSEPKQKKVHKYTADILVAKNSFFESKLYIKLLESLGYSYQVANNQKDLIQMCSNNSYKLILFDKDIEELDISQFSELVKKSSKDKELPTALILTSNDDEDTIYVDELISDVIHKDLLKSVFEKYI